MTDPPEQLEPDNHPDSVLEANLSTVTDDEFFAAIDAGVPLGRDDHGDVIDTTEDVADLRHLPSAERDRHRRFLEERNR
jgi:hypothetical protein